MPRLQELAVGQTDDFDILRISAASIGWYPEKEKHLYSLTRDVHILSIFWLDLVRNVSLLRANIHFSFCFWHKCQLFLVSFESFSTIPEAIGLSEDFLSIFVQLVAGGNSWWGKYLNIQYSNICGNSKVGVSIFAIFAIFAVGGSLGHIHRLIGAQAACSLLQMSRFYMPGIPEGWKIMKLDGVQTNFKENNESRNWILKEEKIVGEDI